MSFTSLLGIEFQKIHRSKIILILSVAVIILWLPFIFNGDMNFKMQEEGIAAEYNFLIQGFLGMSWFIFPASMVVSTVLLNQMERSNRGILKMLALPVSPAKLCIAKFVVLFSLSAVQVFMSVVMYYISAVIVTGMLDCNFLVPPLFVLKEAGLLLLSSIPMLAVFWLLAIGIQTPIFSIGVGFAFIVPSNLNTAQVELIPWLPVAICITFICLWISCICFGKKERR